MLSSLQHEVLNGLLLGDGCLYLGKTNKSPLLTVGRSEKDLAYLQYQFSIFEKLCSSKGIFIQNKFDKKRNKLYKGFKFRTRSLFELKPYYDLWYPEGKKIVPSSLELTPTTLANWFCDDGSISFKVGRNKKIHKTALVLKLSTNSFHKNEVEFLISKLEDKCGKHFSLQKDSLSWYKKKNPKYIVDNNINYYILTYTEGANNMFEYMEKAFPLGMDRKLNVWKEFRHGRLVAASSTN